MENPSPPPRRRPRRFSFHISVRGLIALVMVAGLVLGYGAYLRELARAQLRAAEAIRKADGRVFYTWQFDGDKLRLAPGGRTISGKVPFWPDWLVDTLGVEYFGEVREVHIGFGWESPGGPTPTAERIGSALPQIGRLPGLRQLSLVNVPVSDAGLECLRDLKGLEVLDLGGTLISDVGLSKVAGLDRLWILKLDRTAVTDAGLAYVAGLTRLSRLSLSNNPGVTDGGLVHLRGLNRLEMLYAHGTEVSDAGARDLKAILPRVVVDR